MKKSILNSLSIFLFSFIIFNSCKTGIVIGENWDAPDIYYENDNLIVSIPVKSADTKYINVYRQDVTIPNKESEIVNIGVLFPKQMNEVPNEKFKNGYPFPDSLVYKNHKYKYMLRYSMPDRNYKTEWSDPKEVKKGYDASRTFHYQAEGVKFIYNSANYSVKIEGSMLLPNNDDFSEYSPMIIVSNSKDIQLFPVDSVASMTEITLRDKLPDIFLDKEIKITGLLAQKKEYVATVDSDGNPIPENKLVCKRISFTEPTPITFEHGITTIVIPSLNGSNGLDYSRKISH